MENNLLVNKMNILTEVKEINEILNEYRGNQARVWMFDITHVKLAIKIYSNQKGDVIYLIMSGCKYIKGLFSLCNPDLYIAQYSDDEISQTVLKLIDKNSDFELSSTSGIALAKGMESEFGDSFENFLQEQ